MKRQLMNSTRLFLLCGMGILSCPSLLSAQSWSEDYSGTTFAERWAWADAVVAGRCMKIESKKRGNLMFRSYTFQTTRVLKDRNKSAKVGSEITTSYLYRAAKKGDEYLIFNFKDSKIGLPFGVPMNTAILAYCREAPSPAVAPPKRMPYFVKRLSSKNEVIAADALAELANTAAKHFVSLPKGSVDLLEKAVLKTGGVYRPGIKRLVAGYLLIEGAKGLDRLDTKLKSDSAVFTDLIDAIHAMDFVWRNGEGRISKERLRKSLRLLIGRPVLANNVVMQLTNWKDWSVTVRLAKLYGLKGYKSDTVKYYIIRHMLTAAAHGPVKKGAKTPAHVVTARKHLAELQKKDPVQVAKVRKRFDPNQARRETWRQGKLADPKIDKVATGLSGIPVRISAVQVIKFHPDGKTLIAGSGDGTIRWWNVSTGRLNSKLKPHSTWCFALAYRRDGKRLATGGGDNLIKVYGTAMRNRPGSGRVLYATLNGHTNDVHAVAFGPKGEMLFSAGDDMVVHIWDLKTRSITKTLAGHSEAIPCLAVSLDGSLVATGSRDNTIRVWDVRTGKLLLLITGHKDDVHSIAFSPDGKTLASASYDETVKLWDIASGNLKKTLRDHTNWVFSLAYSPDGKRLASADKDGRIVLWDVSSGKKTAEFRRQKHVSSVAFSPDGKYLASSAPSQLIVLWNVKTKAIVRNIIAK